jgi:hypothetical protein
VDAAAGVGFGAGVDVGGVVAGGAPVDPVGLSGSRLRMCFMLMVVLGFWFVSLVRGMREVVCSGCRQRPRLQLQMPGNRLALLFRLALEEAAAEFQFPAREDLFGPRQDDRIAGMRGAEFHRISGASVGGGGGIAHGRLELESVGGGLDPERFRILGLGVRIWRVQSFQRHSQPHHGVCGVVDGILNLRGTARRASEILNDDIEVLSRLLDLANERVLWRVRASAVTNLGSFEHFRDLGGVAALIGSLLLFFLLFGDRLGQGNSTHFLK